MWFFKIFFQISICFIELWLIFCKFRSYERSKLQVHKNDEIQLEILKTVRWDKSLKKINHIEEHLFCMKTMEIKLTNCKKKLFSK